MAFQKRRRPPPLTKEEQVFVQEKLNAYKKFFKPIKGEIVCKRDDCPEEVVIRSGYCTEDEIKKDAEHIVSKMNELDTSGNHWRLLSWRIINRSSNDLEEENEKVDG